MQPVLFIAPSYPPENVIGALRPARFVRYLPEFGFQPYVVTASPQPDPPPANVRHAPFRWGLLEAVLQKTVLPYWEQLSWVPEAVKAASYWLDRYPIRLVFSTSPPLAAHFAALRLKKRRALHWVADFRDPLQGNFGRMDWRARCVDPYLERYLSERMDAAVFNTPVVAERWKARYPALEQRAHFIYNGFDPSESIVASPLPQRPYQVWIHAGSLYVMRYPQRLLPAVWRLFQTARLPGPVQLRFVGYTPEEFRRLPGYSELVGAGSLNLTAEHIPMAQARREMAEADGMMVFDHYHPEGNSQIPAKVFDYVRVGRPILAFTSPGSPLEKLLQGCGILHTLIYDEEGEETVERKLLEFYSLPREPRQPSAEFSQTFNGREQAASLARIFQQLLGG